MSTESLIDLSKTLSRKSRVDILKKLCMKSYRNSELSANLHVGKERVSEALTDLVASRLAILFEREAIIGEKHTMYVASPFGNDILNVSDKLDSIKEKFPEKILDFGDGIKYILKYYLEADFKVNHNAIITRGGCKINLEIKGMPCEKKNCEITCEPVIKNIAKRFGDIDPAERVFQSDCSFKIKLIRK